MHQIPSSNNLHQALQRFAVDDPDLKALEALASRFNMFEALGVVHAERKHSNFLGFLLNPNGSHGLGDRFLKRFLQAALETQPEVSQLTPIDVHLLGLTQAEVRIEHDGIDVLILDAHNHICVILENKIYSTQHSDQLAKYHARIAKRYPAWKVFGVYLTIDGEPSKNDYYAPISHAQIRTLLLKVSAEPDLRIDEEVQFALKQYTDVLGRHFMADEKIKALCEKLYREHKQAIDLIISYRPDPRQMIFEKLKSLVEANAALDLDYSTNSYVRFLPKALDLSFFKCGFEFPSKRLFLFEVHITRESVILFLEMGPGDPEKRKEVYEFALAHKETFQFWEKLSPKWQMLFKKPIIEKLDDEIAQEAIIEMIESKWEEFLTNDLPCIEKAFLEHPWPTANS